MTCLSEAAIQAALAELPGWSRRGDRIYRTYHFPNFTRAFAFMTSVSTAIEKLNHHPAWANSYSIVHVSLTTGDAGGITALDFELARIFELTARNYL